MDGFSFLLISRFFSFLSPSNSTHRRKEQLKHGNTFAPWCDNTDSVTVGGIPQVQQPRVAMAHNATPAATYTMASDRQDGRREKRTSERLSPLTHSRETGEVMPEARPIDSSQPVKALPFAKSWHHMVAGA